MTKRESIIQAIAAVLTAIPGASVFRARETAADRGEGAIIIVAGRWQDVPVDHSYDATEWQLTLSVMILSREANAIAQADGLNASTHAAILADRTLGGLAETVIPKNQISETTDADGTIAVQITQYYEIHYTTTNASLTS